MNFFGSFRVDFFLALLRSKVFGTLWVENFLDSGSIFVEISSGNIFGHSGPIFLTFLGRNFFRHLGLTTFLTFSVEIFFGHLLSNVFLDFLGQEFFRYFGSKMFGVDGPKTFELCGCSVVCYGVVLSGCIYPVVPGDHVRFYEKLTECNHLTFSRVQLQIVQENPASHLIKAVLQYLMVR